MRFLMVWSVMLGLALAVPVTFTYTPPQGLDLSEGAYTYKFLINGGWPGSMWAGGGFGQKLDPQADRCTDDGFGGQNALRVIGAQPENPQATGIGPARPEPSADLNFEHDPKLPKFVSVAAGRLSVRFAAGEGAVKWAIVQAEGKNYPMHRQLWQEGNEIWRVALPAGVKSYRIRLETAANKPAVFGPFGVNHPLTGLDWVGKSVGYQIFPERFWNGDKTNDAQALETDEYNFNQTWKGDPQAPRPYLSNWNDPPARCTAATSTLAAIWPGSWKNFRTSRPWGSNSSTSTRSSTPVPPTATTPTTTAKSPPSSAMRPSCGGCWTRPTPRGCG